MNRPRSSLLTPRQLEVLLLLARGRTVKEVASDLGIAPRTIREHVREACERIEVDGLLDAFRSLGWLLLPTEPVFDRKALIFGLRALRDAADSVIEAL